MESGDVTDTKRSCKCRTVDVNDVVERFRYVTRWRHRHVVRLCLRCQSLQHQQSFISTLRQQISTLCLFPALRCYIYRSSRRNNNNVSSCRQCRICHTALPQRHKSITAIVLATVNRLPIFWTSAYSVITRATPGLLASSCVRPSVCLSVIRQYCTKTAKCRITQTMPRDSPTTLLFLTPTVVSGRRPIPP